MKTAQAVIIQQKAGFVVCMIKDSKAKPVWVWSCYWWQGSTKKTKEKNYEYNRNIKIGFNN